MELDRCGQRDHCLKFVKRRSENPHHTEMCKAVFEASRHWDSLYCTFEKEDWDAWVECLVEVWNDPDPDSDSESDTG